MLEVATAVVEEIGAERTGIRISPVSPANGVSSSAPQAQFDYIVGQLDALGIMSHQSQTSSIKKWKDAPARSVDVAGTKFVYRQLGAAAGVPVTMLNHWGAVLALAHRMARRRSQWQRWPAAPDRLYQWRGAQLANEPAALEKFRGRRGFLGRLG